ncbi:MAG: GNAT family N-acetyltransferase [Mesorhizobium sp.]|nr:MAG: GNAT family N-acetyltransferase [Mesorhizobium sp.]
MSCNFLPLRREASYMDQLAIGIRRAMERDQQAIRVLVHSERLNPTGLNWPNFLVAVIGGRIIGAVQMRKHTDGSRELGSLVVAKEARGHGIASRLIDALLAEDQEPVWIITSEPYAGASARWGFEQIEAWAAPVKVRRNHLMGSLVRIISFVMRRPVRRLLILERRPAAEWTTSRPSVSGGMQPSTADVLHGSSRTYPHSE